MGVILDRLEAVATDAKSAGVVSSDEDIARKAGVTYQTYRTAKKGRAVSIATAHKIAVALKKKLVSDLQSEKCAGEVV